ncbi:MAG: HtrA2 peptidase [Candidatus Peregrinibacteria bacterium GW2011_GWE2_39_6]|nr:MAG: HtrA2 peptidase [Candidatus Peregrinibacteria bacterium GW2011_GWF2_39_17]KKR25825.1 MAG: HtrA2 peptidase [Candidatus Peregrinibacteria bacterium GW2011_GWE2_39_6]HCW32270.1 hypothetical protein [Candidatus Peregrinibacteria bacterium]
MGRYAFFMKIFFIFSTLVGLFFVSFLGGISGALFANKQLIPQNSLNSTITTNQTNWVAVQKTAIPAVISIVKYSDQKNKHKTGGGTGFIIDPTGIAITNKHVVTNAAAFYVAVDNLGSQYNLEIKATDPLSDLAIIKLWPFDLEENINSSVVNLPYLTLGDSSKIEVGMPVLAIGNALSEYENTVTAGIISANGRKLIASDQSGGVIEQLYGLFQTDAAINPGGSGGPLLNEQGEVIGINTAIDTEAQGIGFAIPINDLKPAIETWKKYGQIIRPMLGVRYIILNKEKAQELNLKENHGALISGETEGEQAAITKGSPAEKAGLQIGDLILEIDNKPINEDHTIQDAIAWKEVGDNVILKITRGNKIFEISVELTKMDISE